MINDRVRTKGPSAASSHGAHEPLGEVDRGSPHFARVVQRERRSRRFHLSNQCLRLLEGRPLPCKRQRLSFGERFHRSGRHTLVTPARGGVRDEPAMGASELHDCFACLLQAFTKERLFDVQDFCRLRPRQFHELAEHESDSMWSIQALEHREAAADLQLFNQQGVLRVRRTRGLAPLSKVVGEAFETEVGSCSIGLFLTSRM